eukprot:5941524-Pleurochrysis_carterae.AAC.1
MRDAPGRRVHGSASMMPREPAARACACLWRAHVRCVGAKARRPRTHAVRACTVPAHLHLANTRTMRRSEGYAGALARR